MNTLTLMHLASSIAVILYTGDELRRIAGHRHLLMALVCVLVCAGSLGGILDAMRHGSTIYDLALSMGVAVYCAHRHRRQVVRP